MRNAQHIYRRLAMRISGAMLALMMLIGGAQTAAADDAPASAPIAAALASPDRLAGDSEEDTRRRAADVLEFMGVAPGQQVLDYFAGGGYNTELLSRIVGPSGSVIAYYSPAGAARSAEKVALRFASNRLANARQLVAPVNELQLPANSLDGVLFVMAYHDLYHTPKDASMAAADISKIVTGLFQALKPGGAVVVVDHAAAAGSDTVKTVDAMHRIDPQVVKDDFTKAGFAFDGESTVLRNAADDHTKTVFDPSVRYRTDQFIYRFRKPA